MTVVEFLSHPTHDVRIIDKKNHRYILYDNAVLKKMSENPENYEIQERAVIGKGAFFG